MLRVFDGDLVIGVFSVAHEDPAIWGEDERGAHIYLHRIARTVGSRGPGLTDAVLAWARAMPSARARGRSHGHVGNEPAPGGPLSRDRLALLEQPPGAP